MRRIRKLASVVLALALMAGLLAVPASAAGKPYITQVEAGSHFSLAVTSDGSLYAWGYATTAKLFPGGKNGSNVPVKLMTGVKSVAASSAGSVGSVEVRKYDGSGYISYYQEPGTVVAIVKENGDLYTWGDNICYQLGKGYYEPEQDSYTPYYVMGGVVKAATNDHACAAVTEDGDLYFWGYDLASPYGQGPGGVALYADPTVILTDVQDVELGGNLVVALKKDGSVWAMGSTLWGALGQGDAENAYLVDEMVKVLDGCKDIATGYHFITALKEDGTLYGWGSNTFTVLGAFFDDMPYTASPRVIDTNVRSVDAGDNNIYYIKNDGSLWSVGYGKGGLRGIGNDIGYTASNGHAYDYPYWPTRVDTGVRSVSGGASHALYLKDDGTMWGFGGPEGDEEGGAMLGRGSTWGETVSFVDRGETFTSHSAYQWHAAKCGLSYGSFAGMFGPVQDESEPETAAGFTDVTEDDWYFSFVETVAEKGLFAGNGDGTFAPENNMTYAEFLAVLFQFSGDTLPTDSGPNWYDNHVAWAWGKEVIPSAMRDGFDPEAAITRQDMAALFGSFLTRYDYSAAPVNSGTPSFSDEGGIAGYAKDGVELCYQLGIMGGNSDGTFAPDNNAIRAEVAVTMVQMARVMGR